MRPSSRLGRSLQPDPASQGSPTQPQGKDLTASLNSLKLKGPAPPSPTKTRGAGRSGQLFPAENSAPRQTPAANPCCPSTFPGPPAHWLPETAVTTAPAGGWGSGPGQGSTDPRPPPGLPPPPSQPPHSRGDSAPFLSSSPHPTPQPRGRLRDEHQPEREPDPRPAPSLPSSFPTSHGDDR